MNRGMPSMTALFSMLAIAGYENRDKLADMFRNATSGQPAGAKNSLSSMLGNLGGLVGGGGVGSLLNGGLGECSSTSGRMGKGTRPNPGSIRGRIGKSPRPNSRRPSKTGAADRPVAARDTRPLITRASYSRGPIHARRTSSGSIGVITS